VVIIVTALTIGLLVLSAGLIILSRQIFHFIFFICCFCIVRLAHLIIQLPCSLLYRPTYIITL